ncbi:MAG: hypothetical protein DI537_20260 [Stutzerimonas stutzeri]|nr:MAG: hypothetical protein DI537_20260 [Stutzerimonas stutzeri]
MIERHRRRVELICDGYDEPFDAVGRDDFQGMIEQAKQDGWRICPDGEGGWSHYCKNCIPGAALANRRKTIVHR